MSLKIAEFKTTAPHSRNPIYQEKIDFGCFLCQEEDKRLKKKFRDLYSLFRHCNHNHDEKDYMEKILQLASLIIEGSLR